MGQALSRWLSYKSELNSNTEENIEIKPELTRIRKKIKWSVIPESVSEVVWLLTLCGQERFLCRVIFGVKQELNKRSQPAGVGGKNAWSNTASSSAHRWAGGKAQQVPARRTQSKDPKQRHEAAGGGCTVWGRGAQAREEFPEITTKWKIKCTIHVTNSGYPETIPLSFPTLSLVTKSLGPAGAGPCRSG